MIRSRHNQLLLWFSQAIVMLGLNVSYAQTNDVVEEKLVAAYIINIIKFTTWNETPSEIVLCLSDQTDVNPYMQDLQDPRTGNQV